MRGALWCQPDAPDLLRGQVLQAERQLLHMERQVFAGCTRLGPGPLMLALRFCSQVFTGVLICLSHT